MLIVNDFLAPGQSKQAADKTPESRLDEAAADHKRDRLIEILRGVDHLAVALSGGVDSGLLLTEAHAVLGDRVIAITARSTIHPRQELVDAARLAERLKVPHLIIDTDEFEHPDFLANNPQRCYICKQLMFTKVRAVLSEKGFCHIAHGANADDRDDYRPGLKAAEEMGIMAPLMDAGLTKAEVRRAARLHGLTVWDKPSMACLATRFPYGTPLDPDAIEQVRRAEEILADAGVAACRVRHHGDIARIEVLPDQIGGLVATPLRPRIVEQFRAIGFLHITVDLEGYVSGSMNRALNDSAGVKDPESESHD